MPKKRAKKTVAPEQKRRKPAPKSPAKKRKPSPVPKKPTPKRKREREKVRIRTLVRDVREAIEAKERKRKRERKERSGRAKKGWRVRDWRRQRRDEFGVRPHPDFLRELIRLNDARWTVFAEYAEESLGWTRKRIRDEMFSPKPIKVAS